MREGGRIAAAIEVLEDVETRHRPVSEALRDWGKSHRFAGSGDRAAIGNIVYDAMRMRASIAWRMGAETPRALALGAMAFGWGWDKAKFSSAFADDEHAPEPLSESEQAAIAKSLDGAPDWVKADIPEWCEESFQANFDELAAELARHRALAALPILKVAAVAHSSGGLATVSTEGAVKALRSPCKKSQPTAVAAAACRSARRM